jgi:RNA polymerase sigma-70 factor (ECF subfamily)
MRARRGPENIPLLMDNGRNDMEAGVAQRSTQALDNATIGRLFEEHGDRVYGYCLRILGCEHDAADALQDTFANLARRGGAAGRDDETLRFYLFAAARNACFDLQRRRRPEASLDALREAGAEPAPAQTSTQAAPDQRAIDAAARAVVFTALERVPERQRTAWVLQAVGELSHDEIAARLGMNANSVAQLLHRARRALQGALPAAAF